MLTDADRGFAARDPRVPGLAVLLDPDALVSWLRSRWPPADQPPPDAVVVRYLRYKPHTSLVAGVEIGRPRELRLGFVKAVSPRAAPKLAKLRAAVADESLLLAYADAVHDRRLPGLAGLMAGPPDDLATLRYKPERRWVGVRGRKSDQPRLVKVHRPPLPAAAVHDHRAVQATGLPVPELLEARPRHGLLAYRWLDGDPLDRCPDASARLGQVGELLRRLHATQTRPARGRPSVHSDLAGAVRAVEAVHPESGAAARSVAGAVTAALTGVDRPPVLVHGDFSADQVIVRSDGLALVDLDRMGADDPVVDLAGWVAAEMVAGRADPAARPAEVLGALLDGYRAGAPLLARLDALTAAAVLGRAAEPFRTRLGGWPGLVAQHVDLARHLVDGGGRR